jgi:hypothetical protein
MPQLSATAGRPPESFQGITEEVKNSYSPEVSSHLNHKIFLSTKHNKYLIHPFTYPFINSAKIY